MLVRFRPSLAVLLTSLAIGGSAAVGCGTSSPGGSDADDRDAGGGAQASTGTEMGGGPNSGAGAGGSGITPEPGCVGPGFDPLAEVEWDAPAPTIVVQSDADSGPGSLRAALEQATDGDVVGFDAALAGATIALEEQLVISASITLDGAAAPGLTLDGQGTTRILSIDKNRDVVLANLRFVRGRTDGSGGAVHARQADENQPERSFEVVGCTFEDNASGRGGAVRVGWRVNARFRNSIFRRNDGSGGPANDRGFSGGAIATSQDASEGLIIEGCLFEDNVGHKAGAVYNILEPVEVTDSVFIGNRAIDGSGAFFTDGGNTIGPSNDPDSGEEGLIALRRVWIEGSVGQKAGGAMLLWGYPRDVIVLEDVVVLDSDCTTGDSDKESKGGAARIHGLDEMRIDRSTFARNRSVQQGGALWVDGTGDLRVVNSTFSNNEVVNDQGGAMTFNGRGALRVESSAFVENSAGRACGALWWKSADQDVRITNSAFVENVAGDDINQRHTRAPFPEDGGGNLEWVTTEPNRGRMFDMSVFADPRMGPVGPVGCVVARPVPMDSPLVDAGVTPAPSVDATGAPRDDRPDIGPIEASAHR
ncbi:MAG: right-handed parallel beta-helix repeat-containing protein [Myxococcota bacterium]